MAFSVRPAKFRDLEALNQIEIDSPDELPFGIHVSKSDEIPANTRLLVARVDGEIAGFAFIEKISPRETFISAMGLLRPYRGELGGKFLRLVESTASRMFGSTRFSLMPAMSEYKRVNMERVVFEGGKGVRKMVFPHQVRERWFRRHGYVPHPNLLNPKYKSYMLKVKKGPVKKVPLKKP
ncbi:MAG: GNAT family N-acetyltransferase [archaeon]